MQIPQRSIAEFARRRILVVIPARIRGKHLDISEVEQMRSRVKYTTLSYQFMEEERREVDPCGHCGARLYLVGLAAAAALPLDATHRAVTTDRSAVATVEEVTALKKLRDKRALYADEYMRSKHKLLEGCF